MESCAPREKNLILLLSPVMLMPYLQVRFHLADFDRDQFWVWHALYVITFLSGSFTTNVVAAAPVLYCKRTLDISETVRNFCVPWFSIKIELGLYWMHYMTYAITNIVDFHWGCNFFLASLTLFPWYSKALSFVCVHFSFSLSVYSSIS